MRRVIRGELLPDRHTKVVGSFGSGSDTVTVRLPLESSDGAEIVTVTFWSARLNEAGFGKFSFG